MLLQLEMYFVHLLILVVIWLNPLQNETVWTLKWLVSSLGKRCWLWQCGICNYSKATKQKIEGIGLLINTILIRIHTYRQMSHLLVNIMMMSLSAVSQNSQNMCRIKCIWVFLATHSLLLFLYSHISLHQADNRWEKQGDRCAGNFYARLCAESYSSRSCETSLCEWSSTNVWTISNTCTC